MRGALRIALWTLLFVAAGAQAGEQPLDRERSSLLLRVYKTGLFAAFAHDHEIRAPLASGSLSTGERPSVELVVNTGEMEVLDPKLAPEKRAEVRATMLGPQVLDSPRFPQIRFRSTAAQPAGPGRWRVEGELTLRDTTRPLVIQVEEKAGRYTGAVSFRQTDFGIKPVSIGGGTVRVKDEVRLEFDVATRP